jgi:TorA maturation chaperone TorD
MSTEINRLHTELMPLLTSRKNFYQLLKILFMEPEWNKGLMVPDCKDLFKSLSEINEGANILHQFFFNLTPEKVKKEQEEFQQLFIGPGPLGAPPWESFYRSKEHLLFEEWTYQVREAYHRFNLQSSKENNEPDDNLLLELEFMLVLIDQSMDAKDMSQLIYLVNHQIGFLQDHLTKWIPDFCARLIDQTKSQLYTGAAMLLDYFLKSDVETLFEIKEAITNDRA